MSRDTAGDREGAKHRKGSSQMDQQELERELLRQEILFHARSLAEEMNLRLLLDGEPNPVGEDDVLFVESVTVTSIVYPVKRKRNFFSRIKSFFKKYLKF